VKFSDQTKEEIYHAQYDNLSAEAKTQMKDFWKQELSRLKVLFPDALKGVTDFHVFDVLLHIIPNWDKGLIY
jgi:hypothetical protein